MITASQIRAARALIDWGQAQLAAATGLTDVTIRNAEKNNTQTREENLRLIKEALEKEGVEFLDGGVRPRNDRYHIIRGKDCYVHLMDDVFHTLKGTGGEVLIWFADNKKSSQAVIDSQLRLRHNGIKMRFIIEEENDFLLYPINEYRSVPKDYFHSCLIAIYADKIATSLPNPAEIPVIRDADLADALRSAFNFCWIHSKKIEKSSAKARYE